MRHRIQTIATRLPTLGLVFPALVLSSCVVDPSELGDASVPATATYRNAGDRPLLPAGSWWKTFRDPALADLLGRMERDNPTLEGALARYDQSRAALGLARADRFPSVTGDVVWKRKRDSSSGVFVPPEINYSEYRTALNLDWEIDLWGRVRQSVNAARADLEAAAAETAAARLSLQGETARTYFQLRYIDAELDVLRESLSLRRENLELVQAQVDGGESTGVDLARAETELGSVQAQVHQLERSRAEFRNALAILVGQSPAGFSLPKGGTGRLPDVPAGVPSQLLLRRPDIHAAERRIAAAAARMGVVKASYLPRVTLGAVGGVSSLELGDLFDASSLFGEVGPSISVPIYQAGRMGRDVERARAEGAEQVAAYRETALKAFGEVEDALAGIRFLDKEIASRRSAAGSAAKASRLSRERYEGGLASYFEVVDAQRTELVEKRALVQAESARRVATVQLIQALGGGWELPEGWEE